MGATVGAAVGAAMGAGAQPWAQGRRNTEKQYNKYKN